ncbi:phosphate-induced protein 1 [Sporodiniella umbellata]|nr:phosphate-induced protein 1 [Sporodiniella umbellata]
MKLLTVVGSLLTFLASLSVSQNTTETTDSSAISQYGGSFTNQGGNILHDKVNVYIVFYGNWTSPQLQQEQALFMNFVEHISTSPWFKTLTQYSDNSGRSVTGPLNLAAAVNDAGSQSLNLTRAVHQQIIQSAVQSGYLSPVNALDSNGLYIIMGGPDVKDADFCVNSCGYNSYSDDFQYMYIGYPGSCPACIPPVNAQASPNHSPAMDAAITIFSHEIQDILTDPRKNAWFINSNGKQIELGDLCSAPGTAPYQFGNTTQDANGSYNIELNNNKYLVQTVFDLQTKTCSLGQ